MMVVAGGACGIASVIVTPRDPNEHRNGDHCSEDSHDIEHYSGNVAAQGDAVESLGRVLLVRGITQTVALNVNLSTKIRNVLAA